MLKPSKAPTGRAPARGLQATAALSMPIDEGAAKAPMLTAEARALIEAHPAGTVATVNDDGTPAVSPKATFVVLGAAALAFGNIRSPGTLANIEKRPRVEICFVDVLLRKAVRVAGAAAIRGKNDPALRKAFESRWPAYVPYMSSFVRIDIARAELILSPAYDLGFTEEELRRTNLARLNAL